MKPWEYRKGSPEEKQRGYDRWRASVPWTDLQIAAAVLAMAESADGVGETYLAEKYRRRADALMKTGRLQASLLIFALPNLVTECEFCTRKALYRMGYVGRCRQHRDRVSAGVLHSRQNKDAASSAIGRHKRAADYDSLNVGGGSGGDKNARRIRAEEPIGR